MSSPEERLPADMLLAGKYQVIRPLGAGGMGTVYQALHVDIGRTVAVKVLAPTFAHAPEALARFRREARASALIGHPAITDVLDFGETESGTPFIVMEFLRGETLQDVIRRTRTMPPARAVSLALELLDALAAAHTAGIIHRDLKPPNIFLATHPVPMTKLLDFGISKFQFSEDAPLTQAGVALGTPSYMAPEQIRGEEVVPATDLYAVGAILYRLLTGEVPFGGTSEAAVMVRAITEPVRPVRQLRPEVPEPLATFVERLLSKEPEDRASSAAAAREELLRLSRLLPAASDSDGELTPLSLESVSSELTPALDLLPPLEPVPAGNTTVLHVEAGTQELVVSPPLRTDNPPTRVERSGPGRDTGRIAEPPGRRGVIIGTSAAVGGLLVAGLALALPHFFSPEAGTPAVAASGPGAPTTVAQPPASALTGSQQAGATPGATAAQPRPAAAPLAGSQQAGATSGAPSTESLPAAAPLAGSQQGGVASGAVAQLQGPAAVAPGEPSMGLITLTLTASPANARWVSSALALDCNPCTVQQPQGTRLDVELRAAGHVPESHVLVFDQPREEHRTLSAREPAPSPTKPSRGGSGKRLTIDHSNPFD